MASTSHVCTPAAAAAVREIAVKSVHIAIDERIIATLLVGS
ncbi:hypothetical protein [Rhizobium phaseoli]|nr:hypothetical protein [Rhizobium phaseoli]MDK4725525.1 hypothetical protein [Rhizobium phaseoli]